MKKVLAIIGILMMLSLAGLHQIYTLGAEDIESFRTFLEGTSSLSRFLGKNAKISSLLLDQIVSTNQNSNKTIVNFINQVKETNLLNIMSLVETGKQEANTYLFHPWSNSIFKNSEINFNSTQKELSFMQTRGNSIKIYELINNEVNRVQNFVIDGTLIMKMSQMMNQFTAMTNNILEMTKQNLNQNKQLISVWILAFIFWFILICGLIGGIWLYELLKEDQIAFEEVLSLMSVNHIAMVPDLQAFVHRAQQIGPI